MRKFEILCLLIIVSLFCGPAQRVQLEVQMGQLRECKANQMEICTAIQNYTQGHSGRCPTSLNALIPDYLPRLPSCPAAYGDSYSSYRVISNDSFLLCCQGQNHIYVGVPADRPAHNRQRARCDRDSTLNSSRENPAANPNPSKWKLTTKTVARTSASGFLFGFLAWLALICAAWPFFV